MPNDQTGVMVVTWEGPHVKSVEFPKLGILTEARIEQAMPRCFRGLALARLEERKTQAGEAAKTQE